MVLFLGCALTTLRGWGWVSDHWDLHMYMTCAERTITLCNSSQAAHCISANTRLHQLLWGDWEMGTAISCTKCSQVAGLIHTEGIGTPKHTCIQCCFNTCSQTMVVASAHMETTLRNTSVNVCVCTRQATVCQGL